MKVTVTSNIELKDSVRKALKENGGYCPCVLNSRGKEKYKCMCQSFIEDTPVGKACHCGLYIKDEQ